MYKHLLVLATAAAVAALAGAAPSVAAKPEGACPQAFEQRSFVQLLQFAQDTGVPGTPDDHLAFLMRFDKNGDQLLCVLTASTPPGLPAHSINIIDNTANPAASG